MNAALSAVLDCAAIDRELVRRGGLLEFLRQAWHLVEPRDPFQSNWHIDAIAEHLCAVSAGQIKHLLINEPPRTTKSLLVAVFWPAWEWTERPTMRWLYSSYAEALSMRDSLKCRRIIESVWYQARWADVFRLTSDQNVKTRFENDRTGYRLATSVGGMVTGEGGDVVVVDDPHNLKEAHSDTVREGVLRWFDEVMSTRVNDPKTGRFVIVMQRCHDRDLSGHILANALGYEHLCLPMEYDGKRRSTSLGEYDRRKEPGELLWPERFGPQEVADLKQRLGSYAASGQLQQSPSPAGGGIFRREHWRYYKQRPERLDSLVLSWDMSFKDKKTSDFVAGGCWGRVGANKYLLDRVNDRMGFGASVMAVRQMKARWPRANAVLIEDKANGPAIVETLKKEIPGVLAVNPEGGKVARAYAIQPEHEAGNLWLPDPSFAPWVGDFVEQCAAFPVGANDDEVDQMTQAINWFRGRQLPGAFVVG